MLVAAQGHTPLSWVFPCVFLLNVDPLSLSTAVRLMGVEGHAEQAGGCSPGRGRVHCTAFGCLPEASAYSMHIRRGKSMAGGGALGTRTVPRFCLPAGTCPHRVGGCRSQFTPKGLALVMCFRTTHEALFPSNCCPIPYHLFRKEGLFSLDP